MQCLIPSPDLSKKPSFPRERGIHCLIPIYNLLKNITSQEGGTYCQISSHNLYQNLVYPYWSTVLNT